MKLRHKPISRLLAGFLLPHILGPIFLMPEMMLSIDSWKRLSSMASLYLSMSIASIIVIAIPAFIYTILMEKFVNRQGSPDFYVITVSCFLGVMSSLHLAFFGETMRFLLCGATTGLVTGVILRAMLRRSLQA